MLVNLNDILPRAQKGGYAVGLFNTIDTDMLQGAVSAAEELNSPIIIGTAVRGFRIVTLKPRCNAELRR